MAKRKRLSPAIDAAPVETKAMGLAKPFTPPRNTPPIAQVAGDSAAQQALQEVAGEMTRARSEGRLVQKIPLGAIVDDHLVRDRVIVEDSEMESLVASLTARGQQTPIEVVALESGRYGLISGWRRVQALRRIDAAGTALAILRAPETATEAYQAMIEENEIRVGLSYYERARIVVKAVELGMFPNTAQALPALFSAATPPKRSKIGSFTKLIDKLGDHLAYPAAIPERLGLALVKKLEEERGFAAKLVDRLRKAAVQESTEELALLERALKGEREPKAKAPLPALELAFKPGRTGGTVTLKGREVTQGLADRLQEWLKTEVSRAK